VTLPINSTNATTERARRLTKVREALRTATRELEALGHYDDRDLWEAQMHILGAVGAVAAVTMREMK
jgi:hypothetical protein